MGQIFVGGGEEETARVNTAAGFASSLFSAAAVIIVVAVVVCKSPWRRISTVVPQKRSLSTTLFLRPLPPSCHPSPSSRSLYRTLRTWQIHCPPRSPMQYFYHSDIWRERGDGGVKKRISPNRFLRPTDRFLSTVRFDNGPTAAKVAARKDLLSLCDKGSEARNDPDASSTHLLRRFAYTRYL